MEHVLPESPLVSVVRGRGRLTIPKPARQYLSLAEGDRVLVVAGRKTLELIPVELVARDRLWSLTDTVRSRIESAEDDVSSGRFVSLSNPNSLGETVEQLLDAGS